MYLVTSCSKPIINLSDSESTQQINKKHNFFLTGRLVNGVKKTSSLLGKPVLPGAHQTANYEDTSSHDWYLFKLH